MLSLNDATGLVFDRILKVKGESSRRPVFVGISGVDCAGKSTLAQAVVGRAAEQGLAVQQASIDDFLVPETVRPRREPEHVGYFEDAFDYEGFRERLAMLQRDDGCDLVVAEGYFLFRRELRDIWDLKIWLEIPLAVAVERGVARDASFFGSPEKAREVYENRCIPAYRWHLRRDEPREATDLVLNLA
jgi:uridine kinase